MHALVMELVEGPTLAERIAQGADSARRGAADRAADRRGARGGARAGDHPSRSEAGEHQGPRRRHGEGAGLRAGEGSSTPESSGVSERPCHAVADDHDAGDDAGRRDSRHRGVHEPRAGEGPGGGQAERHVGVWRRAVRDADGTAAVRRRRHLRHARSVLKSEPDWNALPADVPPHIRTADPTLPGEGSSSDGSADISIALFVMSEAATLSPAAAACEWADADGGPIAAVAPSSHADRGGNRCWVPLSGTRRLAHDASGRRSASRVSLITPPVRRRWPSTVRVATSPSRPTARTSSIRAAPERTTPALRAAHWTSSSRRRSRARPARRGRRSPRRTGRWIGFVEPVPVTLKKVAITGGPALDLCRPRWRKPRRHLGRGRHDHLRDRRAVQQDCSACRRRGGEPTVLTRPNRERGEKRSSLAAVPAGRPGRAVHDHRRRPAASMQRRWPCSTCRTGTQKILMRGGSQARYVSSGHLVYVAAGTLRAVAFDLGRLGDDRHGDSGRAAGCDHCRTAPPSSTSRRDGTLVYVAGGVAQRAARTLVWVDRQGREEAIRPLRRARISIRGCRRTERAWRSRSAIRRIDVWLWDLARETLTRVTSDPGLDQAPVWTPDGRRLIFSSSRRARSDISSGKRPTAPATRERLTESPNYQRPTAVSPDGTRLVFREATATTGDRRDAAHGWTKDRR